MYAIIYFDKEENVHYMVGITTSEDPGSGTQPLGGTLVSLQQLAENLVVSTLRNYAETKSMEKDEVDKEVASFNNLEISVCTVPDVLPADWSAFRMHNGGMMVDDAFRGVTWPNGLSRFVGLPLVEAVGKEWFETGQYMETKLVDTGEAITLH